MPERQYVEQTTIVEVTGKELMDGDPYQLIHDRAATWKALLETQGWAFEDNLITLEMLGTYNPSPESTHQVRITAKVHKEQEDGQ